MTASHRLQTINCAASKETPGAMELNLIRIIFNSVERQPVAKSLLLFTPNVHGDQM